MRQLTQLIAALLLTSCFSSISSAQTPQPLELVSLQDLSDNQAARATQNDPQNDPRKDAASEENEYFQESPFADSEDDVELIQPSAQSEATDNQDAGDANTDAETFDAEGQDDDETDGDDDQRARDKATLAHLQRLRKPVSGILLTAGVNRSEVPENRAQALTEEKPDQWVTSSGKSALTFERYTVCITHQSLYYENANLERCGIGHGYFQSACSSALFLRDTMFLAYKIGRKHPNVLVRSRGDCLSCESFPTSLKAFKQCGGCSKHGVLSEAAALAGFSLLLL